MADYLLVDGYNIIHSWPKLKKLAEVNLDAARNSLQDTLCNYQGFTKIEVILVFDGYKVKNNPGTIMKYNNIHVVFTKEAETADQYIEKVTHSITKSYNVRVATSDWMEQIIILGAGATRITAQELLKEVKEVEKTIKNEHLEKIPSQKNWLFDNVSPELAELLEKIRLDK